MTSHQPDSPRSGPKLGSSPFALKIGLEHLRVRDGVAKVHMPFDPSNCNMAGVIHGGAILSLADISAGAAISSTAQDLDKFRFATVDLSLSFVKAAKQTGLLATATVLNIGQRLLHIDVRIENDQTTLIAMAKVIYSKTPHRSSPSR